MYGVVGQMQREEGARKVRRGLSGVVRDGRSAGGRAYGYRPTLGKPGVLEIVQAEANVIRRIFAAYAGGESPRTIASALNQDGVSPPRGKHWNASSLNGSGKRGHGILRNPMYKGNLVWNRVRMLKDPSTGKRVSRPNAVSEWQTTDTPHLRIVDPALFDQVSHRLASVGGPHARQATRSKRMLSGLLKCGYCGGGMSIIGSDRSGPRIQCSVSKESGACSNSARYYVRKIEQIVIEALRLQLSDPDLVREYVKAYRDERMLVEGEARRKRSTLDRDYAKARAEIQRIVASIAKGLIADDEASSILEIMRSEISRLEIQLAAAETTTNVIELHPQAVQRFKENIEALADILSQSETVPDLELTATFRSLVERVIAHPRKAGEEHEVSIKGHLASLIGTEVSAAVMVAREGLEPPTPGL